MLGRVRDISIYNICIVSSWIYVPTTTEAISEELFRSRDCLDMPNIPFIIDKNGNKSFHQSNYFTIWLENKRINNLSKKDFCIRFIAQVLHTGATVIELETITDDIVVEKYNTSVYDEKELKNTSIANAMDITMDEYKKLIDKITIGHECTTNDMLSMDKFKLMKYYNIDDPKIINSTFVATFDNLSIKTIWKNLNAMDHFKTVIQECLRKVKELEASVLSDLTYDKNSASTEHRDLLYQYSYRKHSIATNLLDYVGMVTDDKLVFKNITEVALILLLQQHVDKINQLVPTIYYEFGITMKFPSINTIIQINQNEFLKDALRFINKILYSMYGIKINKVSMKHEIIQKYCGTIINFVKY
jgi:hypothetical protein